jgi:GNAT superfamily N-acetyltransferase
MDIDRYEVRAADERDVPGIVEFNERILLSDAGRADPFTISMRNEIGYATDSLYGANDFITFVSIDNVDGRIVGRCLLNTCPTPDDFDISAYGSKADRIVSQCRTAVFSGDLIYPDYRGKGLHSLLIQARIAWLLDREFEYMFIPILKGNRISLNSYLKLGIEYLGSKTMQYQTPMEVELYGRKLKGLRRQSWDQ